MRLHLYVPDSKKELVNDIKLLLQAKGSSLSQFFLKCIEEYADKHKEELKVLREFKRKSKGSIKTSEGTTIKP